jgi:CHC2 zinc finger
MSGVQFYEALFGRDQLTTSCRRAGRSSLNSNSIDRASLPTPVAYLTSRGALKRRPRGDSVQILCPFHKAGGERHPSMLVSLVDGHFKCMACGAKGGDIVALHRLITGLGFKDAVRDLGGRFHD